MINALNIEHGCDGRPTKPLTLVWVVLVCFLSPLDLLWQSELASIGSVTNSGSAALSIPPWNCQNQV